MQREIAVLAGHPQALPRAPRSARRCAPRGRGGRGHSARRRRALAEIVDQRREAHRRIGAQRAPPDRAPSACARRYRSPGATRAGCGTPNSASISGYMRCSAPHSRSTRKNARGRRLRAAPSPIPARRARPPARRPRRRATMRCISAMVSGATRETERREARGEARHAAARAPDPRRRRRRRAAAAARRGRACRRTDR